MKELTGLAEWLKDQVGDQVESVIGKVEDLGGGGLLSVLGDLLNDAVAEKRSRQDKWRVRECVALCVKMVASAPHIQGQAMDDVQVGYGARIRSDTTLTRT